MDFKFVEWAKNLGDYGLYAIIDAVVFVTFVVVAFMFFGYKRNIRVLALLGIIMILDVLVLVLSEIVGVEILTVARYILHYAMIFVVVVILVVYQNDFKSLFQKIGNPRGLSVFNDNLNSDDELREATTEILTACQDMAKQNCGAIIIIDMNNDIQDTILDSGTRLGATISAGLLESIFITKGPLHDGAVIVRGNKVVAAGCFLPLTQRNVNKEMGTRHRAAIGITEDTDVLSIVASEETGIISVVEHGEIKRYMTMDKLKDEIEDAYGISLAAIAKREARQEKKKKRHGRFD